MSRAKREMSLETRLHLRELRASRAARRRTAALHAAADAEAAAWNAAHPIGTEVDLTNDFGQVIRTRTRSIAWRICDHASVKVEGITGAYLLERIRPVPAPAGEGEVRP